MADKGGEVLEVATKAELPMLSDEDICLILSLMPIDNLPACAAICKHWAAVLRGDGLLWSNIFTHRFGGTVEPTAARHACNRCMSTIRALAMTTESCRGMRKTAHHLRPLSRRAGAADGQLGPLIVISGGATDHFNLTRRVPPPSGSSGVMASSLWPAAAAIRGIGVHTRRTGRPSDAPK